MKNTIRQYLNGALPELMRKALQLIIDPVANINASAVLTSAGLAANGAVAKTGSSTTYAVVNRFPVQISGSTNLPALVGTVANGQYGGWVFYTDQGGNLYSTAITPAATFAGMGLPATPLNYAMLGMVLINPTGTGSFVGGTTSLTDGTVVPNAVFINTTSGVDPSISVKG